MTAELDLDSTLGEWMRTTAPQAPPVELHDRAMELVRRSRPRSAPWIALRQRLGWSQHPAVRLISVVTAAALLVVAVFGWSALPGFAPNPTAPTPTLTMTPNPTPTADISATPTTAPSPSANPPQPRRLRAA